MNSEEKDIKHNPNELGSEKLDSVSGGWQINPNVPWAKSRVIHDCPVYRFSSKESEQIGFIYAGREIYVYKLDESGIGMYLFDANNVPGLYTATKYAYIDGANVDISGDWHDYEYNH